MASTTTGTLFASLSSSIQASNVAINPAILNLAALNVQAALAEHQGDIDLLTAGAVFQGGFDASGGTLPGAGAAQAGWWYVVTVAGTAGGQALNVGDSIYAAVNNASTATFAANWVRVAAVVGTTNTLAASGSAISSTVNGVTSTITPTAGTIVDTLGFDALGALVKGTGGSGIGYPGTVANTAARLALPDVPGQHVFQTNGGVEGRGASYMQLRSPASSSANWIETGLITFPFTFDADYGTFDSDAFDFSVA